MKKIAHFLNHNLKTSTNLIMMGRPDWLKRRLRKEREKTKVRTNPSLRVRATVKGEIRRGLKIYQIS